MPIPTPPEGESPQDDLRQLRVIVALSDPAPRDALGTLLQAAGAVIAAEAGNLSELLSAMRSSEADLVLLETRLPPAGWRPALAALRCAYPQIPVVLATKYEATSLEREARRAGAAACVSLPAPIDWLRAVLLDAAAQIRPAGAPAVEPEECRTGKT